MICAIVNRKTAEFEDELGIYIFLQIVYDNGNRVGDLALSAIGTGSCRKDEGFFHDEAAAPAVAYRT